jgi:hypothetical protein
MGEKGMLFLTIRSQLISVKRVKEIENLFG